MIAALVFAKRFNKGSTGVGWYLGQGVEAHSVFQVLGRQVRINHRHPQIAMAEYLLERKNAASGHHKVAGKGVSQNVAQLPFGRK